MSAQHTPTPWSVQRTGNGVTYIMAADGSIVAEIDEPTASIIVRACNAHDELVGALRSIAEGNLGDAPGQATYGRVQEFARAALAKASA